MRLRFSTLLALAAITAAQAAPPASCEGEASQDRLVGIEEHGDLGLASGRTLKLADIRLAEGASARLADFSGQTIAVQIAGGRDRWGRLPARAVLARDGTDLAALLLADGLAFVDVGEADALCRPGLLAAEAEARRAWRGAWGELFLPADDPQTIAAQAGRFVVLEGRLASVGERARWTYLNFGRDFSRDVSVSISKRNWEAMKSAGLSAEGLTGRRVRVRGIVEIRRAPRMEIRSAEMIELLEARGRSSAPDTAEP